jgi:hypothetical protein
MRVCTLVLLLLPAANLSAQVPAPGPAHPADRQAAAGPARSVDAPAGAQEKRNWLLARLIVDQNFDLDKIRSIEDSLAQMSAAQLDVLVQVYQERLQQREQVEQAQLDEAKANLEQMKAYRDAVAQNVAFLRAFRQAQYQSFGTWYGGLGGFGSGGVGFGGLGYGGFGYGAAYPYPAYNYGGGMPGYGMGYPAGGGYMPGMGAGY